MGDKKDKKNKFTLCVLILVVVDADVVVTVVFMAVVAVG